MVSARRDLLDEMQRLIADLGFEVVPTTAASARGIAQAYARWGKGVHPAGLNIGDCFAFELAMDRDCPLPFVGNDFARTDVRSAL
ncbi:MAG: PilT protein [Hyphomicrobiales bacterium]|nr:PilT protein [Hyphomicrobiales bacterium]